MKYLPRKLLSSLLLLSFVASPCFAYTKWGGGKWQLGKWGNGSEGGQSRISSVTEQSRRLGYSNLTFSKDFSVLPVGEVTNAQLNAEYSVGSPTATFTWSTTSSTRTYVDSSGNIHLADTVNTGRIFGGYYDSTGFHAVKGLMVEAATVNRATYSGTPEDAAWTKTNITADNDDAGSSSPDGVATSNRLLATAANGTFVQAYAITGDPKTYTASCWLKRKTGTGAVYLGAVEDGTGKAEKTITTSWTYHSVTATTDGDDAGKDPAFYLELATDTDAVYIYGMQLENGPYPTSYVPSPTTAVTRNAETLKYVISGNRTAATESIFIKFMPLGGDFANDGINRYLTHADTKGRAIFKATTSTNISCQPNSTDSATSAALLSETFSVGTSYVAAMVAQSGVTPYVSGYLDGALEQADSTDNFTVNAWGTYFWIGSNNSSAGQMNSLIQSIAIFSDVKGATDVASITNILNA